MEWLFTLLLVAALLVLGVWMYCERQGNANFVFLVEQRTPFALDRLDSGSAVFSCKVPFVNNGSQDGTLTDVYPRHLLPHEYYDAVEVNSRLTIESQPRDDGYWEAAIIFKGTGSAVIISVKLTAKNGDIHQALNGMVDMPIDIVYQAVSRSDWYITKKTLVMTADEIKAAVTDKTAMGQGAVNNG